MPRHPITRPRWFYWLVVVGLVLALMAANALVETVAPLVDQRP